MANLIQFDIQSEWTRLFADSSFSKYKLTETVTEDSNKLLESVKGTYTKGDVSLTKIASKNIEFQTYQDQYGNNQVRITEYTPNRCPDRDYRVVGIILNKTNHAKCNTPWNKLPGGMEPNPVTYDCENGWLECIADPDRWFKNFLDNKKVPNVATSVNINENNTFIRYDTYNNNMTPMYYVLGVGPMMNNGTTLDKTNFRDYWCNNKICLFIYTIESNVNALSKLVDPDNDKDPYEFIAFYNKSDVDFITNGTVPQLTNYINDYYEIKKVINADNTDSYTYIQNKGNTFIKPSNVVSTSVFGPFTIKRIGSSSKYLNNYKKDENSGKYPDPKTISILTSSSNNQSLSGARFSKKFGSRNNTEVLSSSNNTEESTKESPPQFEIDDYNVYITSYYDFSVNNPYIRFGEGITEVYCEIEEDAKFLKASSLYKYEGQNSTINTFINDNEKGWINAVGTDKANEIKDFYNGFNWTEDPTPGSDKMLPPYNNETISNPKKHVPCRIIPVWTGTAYNWGLYCGSTKIVEVEYTGTITINTDYEDKLYTNNDIKLNIIKSETGTGYVIIDK